jgi:hypothetical protein
MWDTVKYESILCGVLTWTDQLVVGDGQGGCCNSHRLHLSGFEVEGQHSSDGSEHIIH